MLMKRFTLILSLAAFAVGTVFLLNTPEETPQSTSQNNEIIPIPTVVNERMENEEEWEEKKEAYLDIIHGNPIYDWRAINKQNFEDKIAARQLMLQNRAVESYANGALAGEWSERGSNDQAGNVRITAFDEQTETAYAIGDGGVLFRGDLIGSSWESLNDHYLLDKDVLLSVNLPGGGHRIIAAKGNGTVYSDDEGQTWTESTGFIGSTWDGFAIDLVELNDADSTIVFLYTYKSVAGNAQNKLAFSKDHGVSFDPMHIFGSSTPDRASMCMPHDGSIAYILDNDDDVWVFEYDSLYQIADNLNMQGGSQVQLEVSTNATDTVLYALLDQSHLYKSTDAGYNFTQLADLPTTAWEVGIGTSADNVDAVYYGEVDLWRSDDGGNSFVKVSEWWEYYSDVANKIHADIMAIQTYKNSFGVEFTLISNHGGVSMSTNYLQTTPNIGMSELNVGQFYDVATSPVNSNFIFGGTQDQGLQRTALGAVPGTISFEQVISGDYGQQQFSNNGQSFWTQYPGADFSYYANALTDGSAAYWYQVNGSTLPNAGWIVPTAAAPNASDDYILVGGGNTTGGSGSYLIKLENTGGTAAPTQFPFDFDADAGAPISAIETTPLDDTKWYVSTQNGHFYHSEDAGASWTEATSVVGPGNDWIYSADIYASRITDGLVFLGGSNYASSAVYMSEDGGETFVPLNNGDLPNTMVHELCMDTDENFLFAATDAGPYVYDMNQEEWFDLSGTVAPIQEYITCEFVPTDNIVRFATWGRGIWDFAMADVTGIEEDQQEEVRLGVYPNPSEGLVSVTVETGAKAKIFDAYGREVMKLGLVPGTNNLNLSFLEAGTYFMVSVDVHGLIAKETIVLK